VPPAEEIADEPSKEIGGTPVAVKRRGRPPRNPVTNVVTDSLSSGMRKALTKVMDSVMEALRSSEAVDEDGYAFLSAVFFAKTLSRSPIQRTKTGLLGRGHSFLKVYHLNAYTKTTMP
jgi:hypothetical protein